MNYQLFTALNNGIVSYTTEFTYDYNGNLKTVKDEDGTTEYNYNEINKVSKVVDPSNKTKEFK